MGSAGWGDARALRFRLLFVWGDEEEKAHERLAASGQWDVSAAGTSGTAGSRGGRLGSKSPESQGWGGRTPLLASGPGGQTGRGRWGRWLGRRGEGHPELPRRLLSLPRVGAPSRALIGAAAAAGRVSAASLRDATPSNCGRDRRYAAASWPGRPARPAPPAPRLPPACPSPLPAARGY